MEPDKKLQIAVLGDLHGHLGLALLLLEKWEKKTKNSLDLILQVGDFGIWPYPSIRLDNATKRFSKKDPEEISFEGFYNGTSLLAKYFLEQRKIEAPIICIRGNHEDFYFLNSFTRKRKELQPIDHYQRIFYLANGESYLFQSGDHSLKIAGLGGIDTHHTEEGFNDKEINRLYGEREIDIFLTHQAPTNLPNKRGSERIQSLIDFVEPRYHFCGHHHIPGERIPQGNTKSYILNEVNFRTKSRLTEGAIGILTWKSPKENDFSILDEDWIRSYTQMKYQQEKEELYL